MAYISRSLLLPSNCQWCGKNESIIRTYSHYQRSDCLCAWLHDKRQLTDSFLEFCQKHPREYGVTLRDSSIASVLREFDAKFKENAKNQRAPYRPAFLWVVEHIFALLLEWTKCEHREEREDQAIYGHRQRRHMVATTYLLSALLNISKISARDGGGAFSSGRLQRVLLRSAVFGFSLMPPSKDLSEARALVKAGLLFMLELSPTACSMTLLACTEWALGVASKASIAVACSAR